ncbi:hypothetical protein [Methylobacterium iners]|uniref:Uncharacterized protein n=1 Tax=Methylobacterium iners TaxID=418707 RepID=A0ABQ4S0S4_9HYPH|nr:hypothetical protein [Methylobacterium iners]GJD96235.1 hypothetical protein OCOJLMKI_3455 [Methylobacterium iners]
MTAHASAALVTETPLAPQSPALILFGHDDGGRPRAAWFGANDVAAARAAASLMNLRALPLDAAHQALAGELAAGRVFTSGRAFVPYVRKDLYRRLVEVAGGSAGLSLAEVPATAISELMQAAEPGAAGDEPAAQTPQAGTPKPSDIPSAKSSTTPRSGERSFVGAPIPQGRDEIGLGSIVLAQESPDGGWWEAEVIGLNGRVFSLRWRDYPTQPTILRKAGELALLPPGEA